jgi:hypothetical protein
MATFTAIKSRATGGMSNVLDYVSQEKKTMCDAWQLVTGLNCVAQSAYTEMRTTKQQFHKTDGRQYYHFVQSFSEDDVLTPQEAHAIGLELAQKLFPEYEVVVATHMDTDHLHNHLVVNSVSFQNGKKLHQSAEDLQQNRKVNDEICLAHGLSILPPPQKQKRTSAGMTGREYRSAAKGESWKFRLMNTIDDCMRYAATREEFIALMRSEGYDVRWTDNRKNITYTTPDGKKCRDDRLHDEKYSKEAMEREFQIRAEFVDGGIEAAEPAAAGTDSNRDTVRDAGGTGDAPDSVSGWHEGVRPRADESAAGDEAYQSDQGADGEDAGYADGDQGSAATGWEAERGAFLAANRPAETQAVVAVADAGGAGSVAAVASELVRLGDALERCQQTVPVMDCTTIPHHIDKKRWRELIAMGRKPDDHAEKPTWQQSM